MRCTWLISANVSGDTPSTWNCPLASVRYRVLVPARALDAAGHQVRWLQLEHSSAPALDETSAALLNVDVVVVAKVFARGSVRAARRAREFGAKLIVDLCDDHFETPELAEAYLELCQMADGITASTAAMAEVIARRTGRTAAQIDDPFEGPRGEPRFAPALRSQPLKLLWFGHPVNFDTLLACLPELQSLAREIPLELHCVTDLAAARQSPLWPALAHAATPGFTLRATPWSLPATWHALAECNLVILPSLPEQKKLVKSPNRAVEALRAGRLPLAYPLPAYQELSAGCWVGEDLAAGIRWAVQNPRSVLAKIHAGQHLLERRFSPGQIGHVWEGVLQAVAESSELAHV